MADHRTIIEVSDATALAAAAAERLIKRIDANTDRPAICLTGGSSPKRLYELLATEPYRKRIRWERVHWFIGDDRFVPETDPLNNMAMAKAAFLDACAPRENVHAIKTGAASPDEAAALYARALQDFYGSGTLDPARPLFDLVLLGVGPDGHVASLFPTYPAIEVTDRWVVGVPEAHVKPFVPRVSLTLPPLASCREMLFLMSGEDKRPILGRVLAGEDLPANRARSAAGETVVLCDRAALPEGTVSEPVQALIVMGVSSSGKSTVAKAVAGKLGWRFADGDDFHPTANVEKQRAGQPLTDADRWPWLQSIADEIDRVTADGGRIVFACSALKRAYRDLLRHGRHDIRIVYLDGSKDLIAKRMAARKDHFMPTSLLDSQFATLEVPGADEHVIAVSIDDDIDGIVAAVIKQLPT